MNVLVIPPPPPYSHPKVRNVQKRENVWCYVHSSTTKQPLDELLANNRLPYAYKMELQQMNPSRVMNILEGPEIGHITAGEGVREEKK